MLVLVLSLLALLSDDTQSALFSSTEDLKTATREHKNLIHDLSALAKSLENDVAYIKR
jgi:arginine deiminase